MIDHMRERCEISAAVAMLLCIALDLIGRLFHLLRVIPTCLSELKLENCGNLYERTPIQDNCKILKMIDYVMARNSTSISHK